MIYAKNKDGNILELLFNHSILLIDDDSELTCDVKVEKFNINLKFTFNFSSEGKELTTSGDISEDGKSVNMTLHKWNSPIGSELKKPIMLTTKDGQKLWMKFRTSFNQSNISRSFHLAIWREGKKL